MTELPDLRAFSETAPPIPARSSRSHVTQPSQLAGRARDWGTIERLLDAVQTSGAGGLLVLAGESGVGKTSLIDSLLTVAAGRGIETAQATCESFSAAMSFFPVHELMRHVAEPMSVEELIAHVYGATSNEAESAERAFASDAEPASRREYVMATFANAALAGARTNERGLVAFVDDLERIDAASVDALTVLVSRLHEAPVLLVCAVRSDVVAADPDHCARAILERARRGRLNQHYMEVRPLRQEDLPRMLESLLDGPVDVPAHFISRLYAETEGNPLFVREVVRSLREPQLGEHLAALRRADSGQWVLDPQAVLWELPRSIEDAVATRLQPLTAGQMSVLENAAVIGRQFDFDTLRQLVEGSEDTLLDELEALMRLDLIRESTEGGEILAFAHAKIRDVIYERLPGLRRTRLHAQVAAVIAGQQSRFGTVRWNVFMGNHLFAARRYDAAQEHLLEAGRHSRSVFEARDAVGYFRRALECMEKAPEADLRAIADTRLRLAEALKLSSQILAATRELELVIESGDSPSASRWALNHLADIVRMREDHAEAERLYLDSERAAVEAGDDELIVENAADLAELHMRQAERLAGKDPHAAADHQARYRHYLELETRLAKASDVPETKARAYRNQAKNERAQGRLDVAIEMYEASLQHTPRGVASHQFLIPYAKALRLHGQAERALQVVRSVLEWSRQIGATRSEAIARQYLGLLLMEGASGVEDPEDGAQAELTAALRLHREAGFGQGIRETALDLFELELANDRVLSACAHLKLTDAYLVSEPGTAPKAIVDVALAQLRANGEAQRADRLAELANRLPAEMPAAPAAATETDTER